ncbi:uncharacterized protein LOC121054652 [Oryza brachyantha]|uniref:uncharacterized protein LOC121054652 n=1 Tax=Oryza brachyantha TaxID=4533 RepID=UPI001ADD536D|nr:uncharacterized protein LOC121054652 [Oryza brachyantha]
MYAGERWIFDNMALVLPAFCTSSSSPVSSSTRRSSGELAAAGQSTGIPKVLLLYCLLLRASSIRPVRCCAAFPISRTAAARAPALGEISAMFSTARFFLPVHPRPHATAAGGRKPALTAVAARPRRGGSRRNHSWADGGGSDEEDGADDRIDANFFGDAQDDEPEPEDAAATRQRPSSPAPEPAGQLRGSDVLRALQRAAAAKEAKKRKKAGARPAARRQGSGTKRGGEPATAREARPIEIRREWATRVHELELRVQQLVDKYHHHPQQNTSS